MDENFMKTFNNINNIDNQEKKDVFQSRRKTQKKLQESLDMNIGLFFMYSYHLRRFRREFRRKGRLSEKHKKDLIQYGNEAQKHLFYYELSHLLKEEKLK